MQTPVCSLIHGPHARSWVTRPESDKHPQQLLLPAPGELHNHPERSLRRRSLPERQIDLRAAGKQRAIGTLRLTCESLGQRQAVELKSLAGADGNLKRTPGEPA